MNMDFNFQLPLTTNSVNFYDDFIQHSIIMYCTYLQIEEILLKMIIYIFYGPSSKFEFLIGFIVFLFLLSHVKKVL